MGRPLDRYGQGNGDSVLVTRSYQAALRPTAWMRLSRSSMTRWY